ncbi:GTP-binding protein [Prochlorococcus marinus]|uniref:GTP-binding protein n=1 Tax=Prochlorococcus marinus TaxID=1219 RepID=UPI0022B551A4|nr:GTP-binding protein [Prochlorococcus marinus]
MSQRLPVTIITGFLGSGKTTLLRQLLTTSKQRIAVIVNEFGSVGLDGDLIRSCGFCPEEEIEGRLIELNNGCLCCTVQDDFLPTMEKLLIRSETIDSIVIETSGLALPKPLIQAIEWPEIRSKVFVNSLVTVVDGEALSQGSPVGDIEAIEKQYEDDENIDHLTSINELFEDQLENADIVLLSRADLISSDTVSRIKKNIEKHLREGTTVIPIANGKIDPAFILGMNQNNSGESFLDKNEMFIDDHDDHQHLSVISSSIRMEANFIQSEINELLLDLAGDFQILRLKGRFWVPNKSVPLQIQMVGPRISSWFEKVPENVWRPKKSGFDFVALSLKEGLDEKLQNLFK